MMNEQNARDFQRLEDQHLENVAGGYDDSQKRVYWWSYCDAMLLPELEFCIMRARENGQSNSEDFCNRINRVIQNTWAPGVDAVWEFRKLQDEYNRVRGELGLDSRIGAVLDMAIDMAVECWQ